MRISYLIIIFIIFCSFTKSLLADEVNFNAKKIEVEENGNKIIAFISETYIPKKKINIKSDIANYNKKEQILNFIDKVKLSDLNNNLYIEGDKMKYEKDKDLFYSYGNTKFNINDKYIIFSKNVFYNRNTQTIYGDDFTKIEDNKKNIFKLKDGFIFDIEKELIKSKISTVLDNENNTYFFENSIVNLRTNEIAGKELKVEFEKSYFGNKMNDPVLKGRSSYSNDDELKVYKAVFSTCNIENKKCRGWELSADEFKHDKSKKIFEYKNSWLKIFDYKVFYLPYFNHPDPSVKRKSGFLTPSYASSDSLGTSINFPYFKILGRDKDITLSPRYYADKSFLLQNEYRQVLQYSNILSDFSFLIGDAGTKGHLFYNQSGKINNYTNFELNLQNVKGDNFLKTHKLIETSKLIDNDSLLISNLSLDFDFNDSNLKTSFKIFEDLSRSNNDRYQYIFPDFNFIRNIDIPRKYNGEFVFNSHGYNKLYNTNVKDSVITNDFLFTSNEMIGSKGFVTDYELLLKNLNNYSVNSSEFDENLNYNLFGIIKVDTSLPLQKKMNDFTHYLKPIMSLRYSPNGNTDLSSRNVFLNYNSVFEINRIGSESQVEGGESLTLGLEFKRNKNSGSNIFNLNLANVIKSNEDYRMPKKSKLNEKRSDIFGTANYNLNSNTRLNYAFSYDKDLKYSNKDQLGIDWRVNNFFTNISYYSEHNDLPESESIKNTSQLFINNDNKVKFSISKDLNDNFTEYYDLIYSYETDCIALDFNFNKSFYRDGSLEPSKNLSFLLRIIPFTDLVVPNVGTLVGK